MTRGFDDTMLFSEHLSAVFCKFSKFLPNKEREAPSSENKIAVAAPIPELAPRK